MGEVPPTPSTLSEEGQEFLSHLLQHDPKQRETAANLLEHNFLKVSLMLKYISRTRLMSHFILFCIIQVYQEDDPLYSARR